MNFGGPQPSGPNKDMPVAEVPNDTVSHISWSPTANMFVAGSWNKELRLYQVNDSGVAAMKAGTTHQAPILSTSWSADGSIVFSGGCDNIAKMWSPAQNQSVTIAQHAAPVKEVHWAESIKMLVTGSWDKTIKFWDIKQAGKPAAGTVEVGERVYSMDIKGQLLTVATADRRLHVYDLKSPQRPFKVVESPLRFQTRVVANFPDASGFAVGSIEGRCGIQYVNDRDKDRNFAFKCHRQNETQVFAVNSIAFHPRYGTFATAGADGVYTFWDKDSKQRLKMFNKNDAPITCSAFNANGSIYAYAVGYDWSKGIEYASKMRTVQIWLHAVQDLEIKPRPKE